MIDSADRCEPLLVVVMAIASPWSVDIACELSRSGYRVLVAGASSGTDASTNARFREGMARLEAEDIAVVDISSGSPMVPLVLRFARNLRLLCRRSEASHLLTLYGGAYAMGAWLSGFRPYSIYWVGSDINMPGWWRTVCFTLPFRHSSLNVINGRNLAIAAEQRFGRHNVVELYIGVDTENWRISGKRQPGQIVCTRWFEPIYDNAVIIKAFVEGGAAAGMSLVFTSSGSELAECRHLADILSGSNRTGIVFLGGVDRERLKEELQASECFVSMSHSDGTSTALLEAMACGCFPILSDIKANREWLDHGCDVELVRVGDASSLARSIRYVYTDVERRRRAVIKNRSILERLASSKRNMNSLAELLRSATT